jgi:SAM-dependent methyltransferase
MDYLKINKHSWNKRTEVHYKSEFYDNENFKITGNSLNEIELQFLKAIRGKKILHLQCHFGQDSISLSKLGAEVTGVDLSDVAIEKAENLAKEMGDGSRFICSDIYNLPNVHNEKYDMVFSSYGTVGWLPDSDKWSSVISHFLKPGGKFIFAEFHPVVWMFDDKVEKVAYRYFNSEPIIEEEEGTYTDKTADIKETCITWNHSLSEIFNALKNNGLEIIAFNEYDYSPYNCFQNLEEFEKGKYRFKVHRNKLPLVYSMVAVKV